MTRNKTKAVQVHEHVNDHDYVHDEHRSAMPEETDVVVSLAVDVDVLVDGFSDW